MALLSMISAVAEQRIWSLGKGSIPTTLLTVVDQKGLFGATRGYWGLLSLIVAPSGEYELLSIFLVSQQDMDRYIKSRVQSQHGPAIPDPTIHEAGYSLFGPQQLPGCSESRCKWADTGGLWGYGDTKRTYQVN